MAIYLNKIPPEIPENATEKASIYALSTIFFGGMLSIEMLAYLIDIDE